MLAYIILGCVQGLTELLPISSSGHLVLVGYGLGIQSPGVLVEVILHVGTLFAVLLHFRREVWELILGLVGRSASGRTLLVVLIIATLPIVAGAPFLKDHIHAAFESPRFAAAMLCVTGVILLTTRWMSERVQAGAGTVTRLDAFVIGCAQLLALLPGISRSGMTISAGFLRGIERRSAARFSFLLSIPAILGATVFEIMDMPAAAWAELELMSIGAGFIASFVSGLVAIHLLFRVLDRRRFAWFGVYCLCAGLLSLWLLASRGA